MEITTEQASNSLDLFKMILIIVFSGGFGGLVSLMLERTGANAREPKDPGNFDRIFFFNCFVILKEYFGRSIIGIAGAVSIIFVGLWVGKITTEETVKNQLFLIGLCVVAGTISRSLVPWIGSQVEDQLKKKISETEQKAEGAVSKADNAMKYTSVMAMAEALLEGKTSDDPDDCVKRMEEVKDLFPTDRSFHIMLGRIYRIQGDYDSAIKTLKEFINRLNGHPDSQYGHRNVDKADALFNIACYYALKSEKAKETNENCPNAKASIDKLKQSISLYPSNRIFAEQDKDFSYLKNSFEEFNQMVSTC